MFASQASSLLADAGLGPTVDQVAQRLRAAPGAREVIAQAQGVLIAHQGFSPEAAYSYLRHTARQSAVTVRDRAATIVAEALHTDLIGQVEP